MSHFFFFLGLSILLVHEMDAVRCAEWRILLGFMKLSDATGYLVFTILHVPLYLALLWFLFAKPTFPANFNIILIQAADAFFVVHVGLHWFFRNHKHYQFTAIFSKLLIGLPGMCGVLDLLIEK